MVSAFVKVRNTDFSWIKMTLFQSFDGKFRFKVELDSVNRLELLMRPKSWWKYNNVKLIIFSDEKRAGMVNVSVSPVFGAYDKNWVPKYALEVWGTAAEVLRFSLGGVNPTEKCWNCFEEKDYRDNFCKHCGKS